MGGYSKVKLGIHKKTGQKVALKIMMADESGKISESKKKQLIRELNVMKKVKHENVIQLIEFDEKASRSYFHQMINGLEAMHKLGIAHRDLKP